MTALISQSHFTDETHAAPLPQAGGDGHDAGTHTPHHTVFSERRRAVFLKSLQLFGNVRLACRAARVSAQTAYRARHGSPAFARLWDAACLAARDHAEQVLADRAINGVEEAVYYHGEEVARRRRYDSRLLLAHLARLDRLEAREEVVEVLAQLDTAIAALEEGGDPEAVLAPAKGAGERAGEGAGEGAEKHSQDPVPCVPSSRESGPGASKHEEGGRGDGGSDPAGPEPGGWIGDRLAAMEAARPASVPTPGELGTSVDECGAIEWAQLLAFEAGQARWWEAQAAAGWDE